MKTKVKNGGELYIFYGIREKKPVYVKVEHEDRFYDDKFEDKGWFDLESKSLYGKDSWVEWKNEVWDNRPKFEYTCTDPIMRKELEQG